MGTVTVEPDVVAEAAPVFPVPNEHGLFPADVCEFIYAPEGMGLCSIQIVPQADGWRAGPRAALGAAVLVQPPKSGDQAYDSRAMAVAIACDALMTWCSEDKLMHGRRQRKQAEALKEWALEVQKRVMDRTTAKQSLPDGEEEQSLPDGEEEQSLPDGRGSDGEEGLHTSAIPIPEGELRTIPLAELHESGWNPRGYYPEASLAELAESMRASGFWEWNPLMARPRTEGGYEIGAGHRRYRAAQRAGIEVVPVVVRPFTDEQFLDILNFDNTGREDVHPLHEAAGWQVWMERTGHGVIDIARRIGQSKEYVYQRLKYSALIDAAKVAFLDGKFSNAHAIQIAREQPDGQKKALKFLEPPAWAPEQRKSVRDLASFIQRDIHLEMEGACFDLASADLVPSAGACTVCPKRTANAPELMVADPAEIAEDLRSGTKPEGGDQCTDPACFESKVKAHLVQIKASLAAKGEEVIEVSKAYRKGKKNGPIGHHDWEKASAGTKGAKTAVIADGYDVGKVITVRLKADSSETAAQAKDREERAQAARQAKVDAELVVRHKILAAVRLKIGALSRSDIEALVARSLGRWDAAGLLCAWHGIKAARHQESDALIKALPGMKDVEVAQLVAEIAVVGEFDQWAAGRAPEGLLALAKRYKVDAAKIRAECEAGADDPVPVKKVPAPVKKAKKKTGQGKAKKAARGKVKLSAGAKRK